MTVRLSAPASQALRIPIAVNPPSGDFTVAGLTDGELLFSSGAERQTFTVTATEDDDTVDEEVTLGFGTPLPEGVSAGTSASATVRLVDDDVPVPRVSFGASSYSASEGGAAATVTVRLSQSASADLTLPITIAADDGTEESDFSHSLGTAKTLSFSAGTTARSFTVTANEDADTVDEEVTLGFGTPLPEGVSAGTPASATVRLVDDDVPVPRVSFGASSYSASEGGEAATVTVRLSQSASADLTLPITIAADDGTEESDFSHSLGTAKTLSFSAGTTARTFTVMAETDPDNADEEVTLGFGTPLPEGVSAGSPAGAAVTLADGVPSPPTDLRLRPASPQGHTRLTVSWTPPAEAVSGYEYRIQGSGSPPSAAASPATISGLEPGTGYRVQVRARNRYGSSGWASGSGRTNANRRPDIAGPGEESVPENTTTVGTYTKSDPDGDATRWLALEGTHADWFDFSAGSLRFRRAPDYERDPHSYRVTVRATDEYDVREHAVTVTITDVPPPPRPDVTVTVPSGSGHEQLDVRWSVSSSGATVTGWKLQYCQTNACGSTTTLIFEAGIPNTTLEDLRSGTRYSVRVKATSDEGDSPGPPYKGPTRGPTRRR